MIVEQLKNISYFHSVILTLLLVLSVAIFQMIRNRRKVTLAAQIPGPKGYFIIGYTKLFTQGPEKLLDLITLLCKKYDYALFKFWIVNKLIICLSKPEDVEKVMNNSNCFNKSLSYSLIRDNYACDGLLTMNNKHDYNEERGVMSKWLKYSNLKSLISSFYEESKVLKHILSEKCERKSYDCNIGQAFELMSIDIIGRTALGEKFHSQKAEYHVFRHYYERLAKILIYRIERPWYYISVRLFALSSRKHEQIQSKNAIHTFINNLIEKKQVEVNEKSKTATNGSNEGKPKPLIEILLGNEHQMSYKSIRDQLVTITIAGHDTTAISNAAIIFSLAHHQDVQENVFREINSIFSVGDYNREPTHEDLQKMEYLERVIKETLRLYPPGPIVARLTENEMSIGNHVIPAGTNIMIPIISLHLNPQYFKDPEVFNPDNFLPDVCRSRHPLAYMPFSAGTRSCIGMKYAMLQMKTAICTLVRSFRFSPSAKCPTPKDLRISFNPVLRFVDGCYVRIEPRT